MSHKKIVVVFKDGLFVVGELHQETGDDNVVIIKRPLFMFFDFMSGKVGFIDIKISEVFVSKYALFYFEPNEEILQKYIEHTTGLTLVTSIPTSNPPSNSSSNLKNIKLY